MLGLGAVLRLATSMTMECMYLSARHRAMIIAASMSSCSTRYNHHANPAKAANPSLMSRPKFALRMEMTGALKVASRLACSPWSQGVCSFLKHCRALGSKATGFQATAVSKVSNRSWVSAKWGLFPNTVKHVVANWREFRRTASDRTCCVVEYKSGGWSWALHAARRMDFTNLDDVFFSTLCTRSDSCILVFGGWSGLGVGQDSHVTPLDYMWVGSSFHWAH